MRQIEELLAQLMEGQVEVKRKKRPRKERGKKGVEKVP